MNADPSTFRANDEGTSAYLPTPKIVPPVEQTTETPQTTMNTLTGTPANNSDFLDAIFRDLEAEERPMVVCVRGVINQDTRWPKATVWNPGGKVRKDVNSYFTLSTFLPVKGVYTRQKAQFHRAYGIYLDDIGTKTPLTRLGACPPSYLIETSPGNHHAGYLLDEPCADLARVEAVNNALVGAGLGDPGAKGPSARLGRLPFGINGKYAPPCGCRLVDWHPDRRYSLDDITERLGVLTVATEQTKHTDSNSRPGKLIDRSADEGIYLPRAMENAVLVALRERGLYKQPLGSGKHDITCPWVHEHTNQIDGGAAYFEPSDCSPVGGFKCQHSHGHTKRIASLLSHLQVSFAKAKNKPTIRVAPGELNRIVDTAEKELAEGGRHYQRGGLIVSIETDPGSSETKIIRTNPNALMLALSLCATWERHDAKKDDFVVTDPSSKYVNVLYDSVSYQHLPILRGIARQPYLRPDGTLMGQAGYDIQTGMFGVFNESQFVVDTTPTQAEAARALSLLTELMSEFEFASEHDKSAALALILTATIRSSLPVAPMGHFKAPLPGSGKSYLQSIVAAFAGPGTPSAAAFPSTEEECGKLLLALLLEAPAAVIFDNLTTDLLPFKSLCSVITEQHYTNRVLGASKQATVPTNTLLLSSGNNVGPVRDMTRRTITVTLEPKCESPATRDYLADPLSVLRSQRARYVSAALTIVRAYLVAGQPKTPEIAALKPLGSFGDWSRLCRAPLVWLGLVDPAQCVFDAMVDDPDRDTLGRLMLEWHAVYRDAPTKVATLVERVNNIRGNDLAEVVRDIADERGEINRKRLGRWISRHQGRIVDGLKLQRAGKRSGVDLWKVVSVVSGVFQTTPGEREMPHEEII